MSNHKKTFAFFLQTPIVGYIFKDVHICIRRTCGMAGKRGRGGRRGRGGMVVGLESFFATRSFFSTLCALLYMICIETSTKDPNMNEMLFVE